MTAFTQVRRLDFAPLGLMLAAGGTLRLILADADVLAHWQGTTGTDEARRIATRLWLRDQIDAYFGAELPTAALRDLDFDPATGKVTALAIVGE